MTKPFQKDFVFIYGESTFRLSELICIKCELTPNTQLMLIFFEGAQSITL